MLQPLSGSETSEPMASCHWKDAHIFSQLTEEEVAQLKPLIEKKFLEKGEILFREGDEGNGIFIIQYGEIEICKEEGFVLSTMQCGQSFGGISTFSNQPRSAAAP